MANLPTLGYYPGPAVEEGERDNVSFVAPTQNSSPTNPLTVTGTYYHASQPNKSIVLKVYDKDGNLVAIKVVNKPAPGQWSQTLDALDLSKAPFTFEAYFADTAIRHVISATPVEPMPIDPID